MKKLHSMLSVAYLFVLACTTATLPIPVGSKPFEPPPAYKLWWQMTEACSGRLGQLADITWYYVPGTWQVPVGSDEVKGFWLRQDNRIVLAEGYRNDGALVRHEMLHALLGTARHDREQFLEKCGGTVACDEDCLRDAGTAPQPGSTVPIVSAESVEVSVRVTPESPSGSQFGGYFALVVDARNPRTDSVVVRAPPGTSAEGGVNFGYRITAPGLLVQYSDLVADPGARVFAPGETKRQVFDLLIGGPETEHGVATGLYDVFGTYGDTLASAPFHLIVSP